MAFSNWQRDREVNDARKARAAEHRKYVLSLQDEIMVAAHEKRPQPEIDKLMAKLRAAVNRKEDFS